jgi:hypothetical protein
MPPQWLFDVSDLLEAEYGEECFWELIQQLEGGDLLSNGIRWIGTKPGYLRPIEWRLARLNAYHEEPVPRAFYTAFREYRHREVDRQEHALTTLLRDYQYQRHTVFEFERYAQIQVWPAQTIEGRASSLVTPQQPSAVKSKGGAPETHDWERVNWYVLAVAQHPDGVPKTVGGLYRRVAAAMSADGEPVPGSTMFREHYGEFYAWARGQKLFDSYNAWARAHTLRS